MRMRISASFSKDLLGNLRKIELFLHLPQHRIKGVVVALSFLSGAIVWEFSNIKQKNIYYGSFDNNDYNNNENNKTKNNNC